MSRFPKRTPHSYYYNEEPVTDLNEALDLLGSDNSSTDPVHLARKDPRDGEGWEVRIPWYKEGSSGGDTSGIDYYQIDTELAERLVSERMVEPFVVKQWGSSYADSHRLVLTAPSKQRVREFSDDMRAKALKLLIPGIHTDLTGEPDYAGSGRDSYRHGRVWVLLRSPKEGRCRVYTESGVVVFPDTTPEEAAA